MATKYTWLNPNLEVRISEISNKGVFAKKKDDWKIPMLQKKYNGFFSQYLQEKIDNKK